MPAVATVTSTEEVAVIGDIHGCSDLLDTLLERLGERPLFVTGDVGDRGPDTRGVIERLIARGARGVRGNHEEWLTRWVSGEGFDVDALSRAMGGAATLASYGVAIRAGEIAAAHVQVPEAHRVWLRALPVALDLEVQGHRYWLTHAGVPLSVPSVAPESVVPHLARHEPRLLLWPSVDPAEMPITGRTVIMGHRRHRAPIDTGNVLAVDTGAGLPGGKLTAVLLPSREFVTVG